MMMRKPVVAALALFLLFAVPRSEAAGVKVVVHSTNALGSVTKAKVADLFLKRVTRWENGRAVTPVDQTTDVARSSSSAASCVSCSISL